MNSFKHFAVVVLGTLLASLVSVVAWSAPQTAPVASPSVNVALINQELAQILKPFNDKKSTVQAALTAATVDATRATSLSGYASAVKDGQVKANLIAAADYSYLEGAAAPVLAVNLSLNAANGGMGQILVNFGVEQSKIDSFFTDSQQQLQSLAKSLLNKYGNAVTVSAVISGVQKDKSNKYVAETLSIHAALDLTKLPANVTPDQVLFTDVQGQFTLDLNSGAKLSATVSVNPKYADFAQNQTGLKEYLEQLEKNNPDAINAIANYAQMANDFMNAATGLQQDSSSASPLGASLLGAGPFN